jgi:hypothetical protein
VTHVTLVLTALSIQILKSVQRALTSDMAGHPCSAGNYRCFDNKPDTANMRHHMNRRHFSAIVSAIAIVPMPTFAAASSAASPYDRNRPITSLKKAKSGPPETNVGRSPSPALCVFRQAAANGAYSRTSRWCVTRSDQPSGAGSLLVARGVPRHDDGHPFRGMSVSSIFYIKHRIRS